MGRALWERVNRKLSLGSDFQGEAGQREQQVQRLSGWRQPGHHCVCARGTAGRYVGWRRVWLGRSEGGAKVGVGRGE